MESNQRRFNQSFPTLSRIDGAGFPSLAADTALSRSRYRKYVQERNFASRQNLATNGAEQYLRVAATATGRMHTDRRYLGVIGGLHSLARHRHQLPIDPDAGFSV